MFRKNNRIAAVAVAAILLPAAAACATTPAVKTEKAPAPTETAAAQTSRRIEIEVTSEGFTPSPITVKKGEPLTLVVTRKTAKTCATEIMIPALDIVQDLPLNEPVTISFTPEKEGTIKYGCGMGQMIAGALIVE